MVLLLADVFLLLTQVLLWIVVGLVTWFVLLKALPRAFLSMLVLLLILAVLVISFVGGAPADGGILETLWKIISFPLTPLGLGIVLIWVLLSGTKLTKVARNIMLVALLLLALASFPAVAYFLAQELEMEAVELIRATPPLESGAQRVIVLLGQGTTRTQLRPRRGEPPAEPKPASCPPECTPTSPPPRIERPILEEQYQVLSNLPIQLTAQGNRLIYAARLYQEEGNRGTNPVIMVSAGTRNNRVWKEGEKKEDVSEARDIQTFLTQTMGVPERDMILNHDDGSVRRSAEQIQQILNGQRINYGNQLILVTSAINMHRSYLTFQRLFEDTLIIARPTDFYSLPPANRLAKVAQGADVVENRLLVSDFVPNVEAFYISSRAIEEYLTALYYFLRGWISMFQAPPTIESTVPVSTQAPETPEPTFSPTPSPLPTATELYPYPPSPVPSPPYKRW
ncbi:MAG TPA: YdcF family protein [Microcoleaceae cyanobacterium]